MTFDSTPAAKRASFWAEVLERPVDDRASDEFAAIGLQDPPGRRPHCKFLKVREGRAAKNRVHCDLIAADLHGEGKRLVNAGATRYSEHEMGDVRRVTLLDPEENELDAVAEQA